jgi:UDP-N-acetyl-D-glucosamine dehydrogenase
LRLRKERTSLSLEVSSGAGLGTDPLDALAARIREKESTVAVLGLGYVGLPLLATISEAGFAVVGLDADLEKVGGLQHGRSHIVDVSNSEIGALKDVTYSTDSAVLADADVVLLCVPTPLTDHAPDLTLVQRAAQDVARSLTPGKLVILESTTYPGTTEEVVRPILEAGGLVAGTDFALAYSPERIDPGQSTHRLENTPKIVAGLTDRCRELAAAFYSHFVREVVTTSSPREAEMAKLIENTFRQVNIALVNELAILARELDVDIWEALQAASTKPFGYMPFWPGPGVGGHFIEHANEVNNRMPGYVVARLGEALNDLHKPIRGTKILAIGVTYKAGVNDQRESPALAVIERLARKGAEVSYHDPYAPELELEGRTLVSRDLTPENVAAHDCVVVLTAHADVDYRMLAQEAPLLFDTRGVTTGMDLPNVVRL